jgi:hypothetical protein
VPNLVNSLTGSNGLINSVNSAFGNQTGSSYTPATFASPTDYTTGGFYGGNAPIV